MGWKRRSRGHRRKPPIRKTVRHSRKHHDGIEITRHARRRYAERIGQLSHYQTTMAIVSGVESGVQIPYRLGQTLWSPRGSDSPNANHRRVRFILGGAAVYVLRGKSTVITVIDVDAEVLAQAFVWLITGQWLPVEVGASPGMSVAEDKLCSD